MVDIYFTELVGAPTCRHNGGRSFAYRCIGMDASMGTITTVDLAS